MANSIEIKGKITKQGVTTRFTNGGKQVSSFSITDARKNGVNPDNTPHYDTMFWNCVAFGDVAAAVVDGLQAGQYTKVKGKVSESVWKDQTTGEDRKKQEVLAFEVYLIDDQQVETSILAGPANPDEDIF